MTAVCPHCGCDLIPDEPIERAGLSMLPYGNVRIGDVEVRLTQAESGILWALLKAGGQPVSRAALAARIGYEGDAPDELVAVHIHRVRRKLAPHSTVTIQNRRGFGVYIAG